MVLHPVGRFPQAQTDEQWKESCFWTLLAHCNHGEQCSNTFRDTEHLKTFEATAVAELMERFVMASAAERTALRMAPCPPHIRKAWHLGTARREAAAERLRPTSRVTMSMRSVKYIFTDTTTTWDQALWETMTPEDQAEATQA